MGRMYCGGSTVLYMNVLASFCRDADEKALQIKTSIENGDFRLYTTLVHGLRGAAAGIGASDLRASAEILEIAGKEEDGDIVRDQTDAFLTELRELAERIRDALESVASNESPEKMGVSSLRIGDLKRALLDMDIREVNSLLTEYASMPLDAETRSLVSGIEQHVLMFEYETAVEIIDAIAE
jgi:HPt (histidine-containing phosphotransfer) domain-containing protein